MNNSLSWCYANKKAYSNFLRHDSLTKSVVAISLLGYLVTFCMKKGDEVVLKIDLVVK